MVSAHLLANCPEFQAPTASGEPLTLAQVKTLVQSCRVMELQNPHAKKSKSSQHGRTYVTGLRWLLLSLCVVAVGWPP